MAIRDFIWPDEWKVETQTAIPKKTTPTSMSDLRNISCTNYLSKILESFVLEKLRREVKMKYNQFGGLKGTRTTHFLIDLQQRILECLEDGSSAVSLLAVDFSKAFNQMSHLVCLEELARRGASTDSIRMTAAFLDRRQMRVKVGSTLLSPHLVKGGSPQGTRLGNYLFTVTIEAIEEQRSCHP